VFDCSEHVLYRTAEPLNGSVKSQLIKVETAASRSFEGWNDSVTSNVRRVAENARSFGEWYRRLPPYPAVVNATAVRPTPTVDRAVMPCHDLSGSTPQSEDQKRLQR
jgi:hypothetical protein